MTSAAGEDLVSIRQRHGGQKTVKRCMKDITFVDWINHQLLARLPEDQREPSHPLPKPSKLIEP